MLQIFLSVISNNCLRQHINVANTFIPLYQIILLQIKAIEMYCVTCKRNIANKSSSVTRTKQNRLILVSNCTVCGHQGSLKIKK